MKKYETVVFDLDGTLLNTLEDLADATNYALRTMQMPERTIGEVRAFVGNGVRRLMELSVPGGFDNPKFEETFAVFKKYYGEHCNDKTRAYDGVVPVLRKLKEKGYALAIVSNKIDFAVKERDLFRRHCAGCDRGARRCGEKTSAGYGAHGACRTWKTGGYGSLHR